MNIGYKIQAAREHLGITQEQLGKMVGLSQQAITKIERGGVSKPRGITKLASALNVNAEWLEYDLNPPRWYAIEDEKPVKAAAEHIKNPAPAMEWISVEDRMPPVFEKVLWWNKYANATYRANTYRIAAFGLENICDCSHWMPLPEPPASSQSH